MTFEITELEEKKIVEWKETLPEIPADVFGAEYQYEYIFFPTGMGTTIKVRRVDGEELDLTDYDMW